LAYLKAQAFSTRLAEQLKACDHPVSATYIASQINVTPHAARLWLTGVNIPKEQNMQALAKWLKVDPRWLRYGGVQKDSFVADYMSLSEEDKAAVMAVVGVFVSIERATPEKILPNHTALISLRLTRIEHAWSDSKSGNSRKL
jgi:hypothetical protein